MSMGALIAAIGLFIVAATYLEWNWFMNHRKSVRLTKLIGRRATRVMYFIFGAGGLITGILMMAGLIDLR